MKELVLKIFAIVLCIVLCTVLGFLIIHVMIERDQERDKKKFEEGYIQACKDFYKGKLKYDLVDNPDGTREWKKLQN